MSWNQIFIKQDKIKIQNKIHEIADILYKQEDDILSLMGGIAGKSLFHFYYSRAFNNEQCGDKAIENINHIFNKISEGFSYHTFAGGLAGIGWLIEFLEQNDFLDCNANETIGELDKHLFKIMIAEIKSGHFDYLHGAGGIALYFLKRKNLLKRDAFLSEFVNILDEMSIKEDNICKWVSDVEVDENKYEKVYNLSLSHGITSIISILSKIYSLDINKEKTKTLLNGAVNYLLSNQQDLEKYSSYFPSTIALKDHRGNQSRLAWCYGDLGISLALWNASQAMQNNIWEQKAIEILLHSSKRRNLQENRVFDAGLCHGTSGNAHIYNRMYFNTGIEEFKEAAVYWYNETLKMARFEDSLSGYKVFRAEEYGGRIEEFGFLEGIAGIGLSLLAAISDINPVWDEALLIS